MSDGSQPTPENEPLNRRGFLLLAAGAAGVGAGVLVARRYWMSAGGSPVPVAALASEPATAAATQLAARSNSTTEPATIAVAEPSPATQTAQTQPAPDMPHELFPDAAGKAIATAEDCPVIIIPRSHWTTEKPDLAHIQLMGGFEAITVHHTGFATAWETDTWKPTQAEIENIRAFHAGSGPTDRNWADIAYHFIVDRAGRVWQARPLVYQGAHVKGHNAHNIGIVLLGNFDLQRGSAAQLTALCDFIGFLRGIYKIPLDKLHTHGELGQTDCPGTSLRAFVARTREQWIAAEKKA